MLEIAIPAPARVPFDAAPSPPLPWPQARLPHFIATRGNPYRAYWSPGSATPTWSDQSGDNGGDLTSFLAHANLASVTNLDFTSSPVPITALVLALPVLRDLNFNGSPITSFNPTTCPSLTELYCANTQLASLNISASSISTLECYNSPITSLVLNNVTTTVQCANTLITSLVAPSHYSTLTVIDCALLTSLTITGSVDFGLYASNTGLTALDLSTSVNMLRCWINDSHLTQGAVDDILAKLVANGKNRGSAKLEGNATPSAAGLANIATLQAAPRRWSITYTP